MPASFMGFNIQQTVAILGSKVGAETALHWCLALGLPWGAVL